MAANSIADRENKTILVVDDEAAMRTLISTVLRQGGYRVLEAEDGEAAVDIFTQQPGEIDLLLTDISLPGQNGCQVAAAIHENAPELQVLFMSGLPSVVSHELGSIPDARERFLQKPFRIAELMDRVQHYLPTSIAA